MFEKERQIENTNNYIIKPENRELLEKLERKLKEYKERVEKYEREFDKSPDDKSTFYKYSDAFYKFKILDFLLLQGKVEERDIAILSHDTNKRVDSDSLASAFGVIKAYVEGENVIGGSGLK